MQQHNGVFVVVEGGDASGKKTQAEELVKRLQAEGYEVKYADFPAYESTFGKLVAKYLRGEYGDMDDVPVEIRSLLYSLDRYQFKHEYQEFLDNGGILVSNRYSQSNYAYQSVNAENGEKDELVAWMKHVDSRMPQPDHVFFLHLPVYVAQSFMQQKKLRAYLKGEEKDIHEKDVAFQKAVTNRYLELAEQHDHWSIINCLKDNTIRTIDDINRQLYEVVENLLQRKNIQPSVNQL